MVTHREPRKGPEDRTPLTGRLVVTTTHYPSSSPRGGSGNVARQAPLSDQNATVTAQDPRGPIVFLHAHPDDEAIFTGGTMRLLVDSGREVMVVFATSGEGGAGSANGAESLGEVRRSECMAAAQRLGISPPVFLGHRDSGMSLPAPQGSLASESPEVVVSQVTELLTSVGASTLVTYDEHGIYRHPDHVVVHDVGVQAARRAGLSTFYEATVDREYLHFVETHLVEEAQVAISGPEALPGFADAQRDPAYTEGPNAARTLGLAASGFGTPSVLVDLVVDVRGVLDVKRSAMAAHASQIPPSSSALRLGADDFADVYGMEWFIRRGPRGPLDLLPQR